MQQELGRKPSFWKKESSVETKSILSLQELDSARTAENNNNFDKAYSL